MSGVLFARTDFSLGESMLKVTTIAKRAKQSGYSAVCIADTMNLSSLVEASQACQKEGIHLISGIRLRIVEDPSVKDKAQNSRAWYPKIYFKTEEALKKAYELTTLAFDESRFYYVPRLSFEDMLNALTTDMVVSCGDQFSKLSEQITDERIQMIIDRIGAENLVTECVPINSAVFDRYNKESLCTAKKYGLKTIFTDLCLYETQEQAKDLIAFSVITAKGSDATIKTPWINKPTYNDAYIKTLPEYIEHCKDSIIRIKKRYPTLDTTLLVDGLKYSIVEFENQFTYKWTKKEPCLPKMAENEYQTLVDFCKEGFKTRLMRPILGYQPTQADLPKYVSRLKYELEVIKKLNFANYFLLVKDILDWSRNNNIITGPGRGSAGGSLIAFLLNITEIDPLRFDLMFERFINPARHDLPDVDMDIASSCRQTLINRIIKDYGYDKVAAISNYITLGASGAIRAAGRAYGLPINEYSCSTKVPAEHGETFSLDESLIVPEIELFATKYPDVWRTAKEVEGCATTYGVHAAGLVVAGEPLINRATVENRAGTRVVCWDKRVVEDMGLIKMDLLGLSTLDVLSLAKQYIKISFGKDLDLLSIPLNDSKVLKLFGEGKTSGVFQFESKSMENLLKQLAALEPLKFEDLVAANALNRPGPMDSGLLDDYVAIKQGLKTEHYDHPNLKDALKETKGVIVYQEQVMRASMDLAGFTASEADFLRKAMGKKDKEKMASLKDKWIDGCQTKSGMTARDSQVLWDKIEAFAGYGFNKSHAVEYSVLSFMCMYIKAYYPTAFYAATMSVAKEDKLLPIMKEAEANGITILPPDINMAQGNFLIIDDHTIMIPFNRLKGVSEMTTKAILEARANGRFVDINDFTNRVNKRNCNIRHRDILNRVGAFASIDSSQPPANDITRLKDQYELMPGLVTKTLKSNKKITLSDIKKELDKNNSLGEVTLASYGKPYVYPYSGKSIKFVCIFDAPNRNDLSSKKFANVRGFIPVSEALAIAGLNKEMGYYTGLMKTAKENKEITAEELSVNLPILERELAVIQPEIIVLMGSEVIRQYAKDLKKPSECVGQSFYDAKLKATIFIGLNPGVIYYHSEKQKELNEIFTKIASMVR